MAQLSDDCFAFGGRLLPLDEAVRQIAARHPCALGADSLPLAEAAGRILAADEFAAISVPPQANSAVDGYAVHFADLDAHAPTLLPVTARIAAGEALQSPIPRGQAARIFTGALMPPGPDTVLMQEDCEARPDGVLIQPGIRQGANCRDAGEDIAAGARALAAGRRLSPADLALLAAIGRSTVAVRHRLRVAIFSTGDEVAEPGAPLRPGQIHDANRVMLHALLRSRGAAVTDGGILPDRPDRIRAALASAAAAHDLVLTSGGVSTGEEDHVRDVIVGLGRIEFWRVGIKPGRPVALGAVDDTPVLGLPGNPVAALVTFATLARPLIDALAGATQISLPRFPVAIDFAWRKKADRREFLRVTLASEDGRLRARLYPKEGAGIITSLTESDALLELPEAITRLAPGDTAFAIPLGLIWGF